MTHLARKRASALVAGGLASLIALSGCASSEQAGGTTQSNTAGSTVAKSKIDCSMFNSYKNVKGKTVEIYTGITSPEDQSFKDSFGPFTACTGITVNYNGSKQFEAQLPVRVKAGNAPDLAFIPQPGLLQQMVATGKVVKPQQAVVDQVDKDWAPVWKTYGTVDGTFYAAPLGANSKSFVWYSPKVFKAKGYEVPKTWDEMLALSDKIAATGAKPWCAGIGSDAATGWPVTDWLEDVVLHKYGQDVYDQWIAHTIPFSDPRIQDSLAMVGNILKNPKYVNGGFGDVKSIASTTFQDGGLPILPKDGKDPNCYLHKQASFYQSNWPSGTDISPTGDVWIFPTPTIGTGPQATFGGGEFVAAFNSNPATQALQYYLSTGTWANLKAKASNPGWVNANKELDVSNLKSPVDQEVAKQLQDPSTVFRFDASDLMPAAVGSGAEWKQLTAWITGQDDKTTLANIDAAWPKS